MAALTPMRVSKDEFVNYLRSLNKNILVGRFAHALLESGIPFPLAIRMLGCSRATFYGWLRLEKRIAPRNVKNVEKLTRALTVALDKGWVPCNNEIDYIKALLAANSIDNQLP